MKNLIHLYRRNPATQKILLTMRLTLLLLVISVFSAFSSTYAQKTKLDINVQNSSVKEVLDAIETQSEFFFMYNNKQVDVDRKVDLDAKSSTVDAVLQKLFAGTEVNFKVVNRQILLFPNDMINLLEQQERKVSGKVTDASGVPIPGATVLVKGTTNGVITDSNGKFSLGLSSDAKILTFSFVGMRTQEEIIRSKSEYNIVLYEDIINLGEVVAVGYGTQKRENLTGAVSTVSSKVLSNRMASSTANLLQGRVAGVTVMQQTGGAPGMSAGIKIREVATWAGSSTPLYVIDGMILDEVAFKRLNPIDIDNISILKDAASASIYGMKAGNGVVLVTTKSGSKQKTAITYDVMYQNASPANLAKSLNAYEHSLMINDMNLNMGRGTTTDIYTPDELEYFKTHTWDLVEEGLRNPVNKAHTLSLTGGSDKIKYYISGNYYNENAMFNADFLKYNLLVKLQGEISEGLTFNFSLGGAWGTVEQGFWGAAKGDDTMTQLFSQVFQEPTNRAPQIDGKYISSAYAFVDGTFGSDKRSDTRINPALEIKYNIPYIKGLSVKAGLRLMDSKNDLKQFGYAPKNLYYFKTTGVNNHIYTNEINTALGDQGAYVPTFLAPAMQGNSEALYQSYSYLRSYQLNTDISYLRQFGKHELQGILGYEQISAKGESMNITTYGFPNLNYQYINGSLGVSDEKKRGISGTATGLNGQLSYYGRFNYNYDQRYLVGVTARADGTYMFSPERRFGYFPAVSAGWNIARESFFEPIRKIADELKLRASYGLTGSLNTSAWQWQQSYNYSPSSGMILGSGITSGMGLGSVINPNITWEKNLNFDLGLDVSFLNKMFTLTADYWSKKTYDILGSRIAVIPNTVGAGLPAVNYGKAASNGFELTLGHNGKIGDLNYHAGANWAISSNKYELLDQAAATRDYQNRIGYPINGVIYGYVCEGIIRDQAQVAQILAEHGNNFTILGTKPRPGMLLYKDIRGPVGTDTPDGKVDGNDQDRITTNGTPRITYGFDLNADWKGLELSINFAGYAKYDANCNGNQTTRNWSTRNILPLWKDYWTPENTEATLPNPALHNWFPGAFQNIEVVSSFWIKNGNFLRLKNATLSYTLPASVISKLKPISNVKFFVSGDNLFLFSKLWKEWRLDPELAAANYYYPVMKTFTAGASITF